MGVILRSLGRGVVKLLISLLVGVGAGMLTLVIAAMRERGGWRQREVPAELYLDIVVGCLSAGAMMLLLLGRAEGRSTGQPQGPGNLQGSLAGARAVLYAHCVVVIGCAGFAVWGAEHRRQVEWVVSFAGGRSMLVGLQLSCLVFPFAVACAANERVSAWRWAAAVVADALLGFVHFVALGITDPIRE